MKRALAQFIDAVDSRTGLKTNIEHFLYEEIPASAGWHQVLGSVALFLILLQFFTGALLSVNYAPTPGDAYDSIRYIMTQVAGGPVIRGLHHWGASVLIVIVVMHMIQVAVWGAYKKPREATWIIGVVLLLLTLAFGLSGYLLPWDNRAYWGTVVTTRIAATAPGAAALVQQLFGTNGESIGVVTFTRFYSAHVLLLPPVAFLLMIFHVYLVRRHGVAPVPGDELKPKKKFFPEQVFKDTVAIFIAFAVLLLMALFVKVPLEHIADPTDTAYTPRPEWYFLFLFQMLKVFEGPLEIVGTLVLPTLAILALILMPFIDRAKMVPVRQRMFAVGVVALALLGWAGLTGGAVRSTPEPTEASKIDYSGPTQWLQLTASQMAGVNVFRTSNCGNCHSTSLTGPSSAGPNLITVVNRRTDPAWLGTHVKEKAPNLTDRQIRDVSALMAFLNPTTEDVVHSAPTFAPVGAEIYQARNCGACHTLNGVGGKLAPPMNGLANRRTITWVRDHFADPKKFSKGSLMPVFTFTADEMQAELPYLFTLPEQVTPQSHAAQ